MAITTTQRKQIIKWVNSNDFNTVLKEIIENGLFTTDVYFHLRSLGIDNKNLITSESIVFAYLLDAKIPFVNSPSMNRYILKEILKKYGSLLDRKISEHLRIKNIQTDF